MNKEYTNFPEKWDEFAWEKEIRRDERRISCYFTELPGIIDLPGEEEIIFEELMSRPDLVPTGLSLEELRRNFIWNEEESGQEEEDNTIPPPDLSLSDRVDELASKWNYILNRHSAEIPEELVLRIACAFAKLAGRLTDAANMRQNEQRQLRKCLYKRSLKDLDLLIDELAMLRGQNHELGSTVESLQHLREKIIDRCL